MLQAKEFLNQKTVIRAENLIKDPLVSVILPTYCRGDNGLLARAIDSVLTQTFKSFELIIVDDGSVDATQNVVKEYLSRDNRIIYVRNDINSGLPALRVNQGLMMSRGAYIAYQFDDDQWTSNALKILVKELQKQNRPALVYGKCHISTTAQDGYLGVPFDYGRLINDNYIANNSVLHSRELFEQYGMYDCHLVMRRLCDWDLWLRWSRNVPFIYIDEVTSIVTAEVDGSLGKTVPLRFDSARKRMGCYRDLDLTPEHMAEYDIEDLAYIADAIEQESVFREFVLPWKASHHLNSNEEFRPQSTNGKQRIICTKFAYDSSVSIMVENFINVLSDDYNLVYIPDAQLSYEDFSDGDILLIARSICESVLHIVTRLKKCRRNVPVIYYMDDNLFQYYRVDANAAYLAPGSAGYQTLEELVRRSDMVVTFNEAITEEVRSYNTRVVTAKTNILKRYLDPQKANYADGVFKIAFMGGGARKLEFEEIGDDLIKLSSKYKEKIEFYFYGFMPEALKGVKTSKINFVPFSNMYYQYLDEINRQQFDLILCPLYDGEFNRCKSPIKLLEAVCCGAVGLFSDVPVYDCIQDGVTGYKIQWGESWADRISALIEAGRGSLRQVYENACRFVAERYSTEVQADFFHYIIQAAKLHCHLKRRTILFASHSSYCAGAESLLLRHAQLAKDAGASVLFALPEAARGIGGELLQMISDAGIELIYLPYTNYVELADCNYDMAQEQGNQITRLLKERNIGLIHSCTLIPAFSYVAQMLRIPHVTSAYQGLDARGYELQDKTFAPTVIHSDSVKEASLWMNKYRTFGMSIGNVIPDEYFNASNFIKEPEIHVAMIGTFQPRKNQLGAVCAANIVLKQIDSRFYLYGYSKFFPDYVAQCKGEAKRFGIAEKVEFPGFVDSIIDSFAKDKINVFLCTSREESIPQSMREAMAMGIPVVSTPVGNVPELIHDGKTGYLAKGFEPNDIAEALLRCMADIRSGAIQDIVENAKNYIARECAELIVAKKLFYLYVQAFMLKERTIEKTNGDGVVMAEPVSATSFRAVQTVPLNWADMVFSREIAQKRRYRIISDRNRIEQIGVVFAMEHGVCVGTAEISIWYKGICLRRSRKAIESITFGTWTYFEFTPLDWCGGKELVVELVIDYAEQSGQLGVYENRKNRSFVYRLFKRMGFAPKGRNTLWFSLQ